MKIIWLESFCNNCLSLALKTIRLMFTPIETFKDKGYSYNKEADTNVLEYLYPVANHFCPDFSGEYDEEGNPVFYNSQAVERFIIRYNWQSMNPNKPNDQTSYLEKAKERAKKYNFNEELNWYIKSFNLDVEKFWYLLLFVYDYCIGKCIENIFVEKESPLEQVKNFTDAVYSNYYRIKTNENFSKAKPIKPMVLTLSVGDKEYSINSHNIINAIAMFCLKERLCVDPNSPLYGKQARMNKNRDRQDTILEYSFISMFAWFFQNNNFTSYKRRKNAKLVDDEKSFIAYLIQFLGINKKMTVDSLEKIIQRKKRDILYSSNGYYPM
ncbi:hypothetical protein M2459_002641 [Parabacteroides sp. PF5-5]|uniref:hypothetical protein n=1 Tax=unclassified Parabacteroides TaxID=2649774 RepID=UPI002473C39F|nr:MULTISPECIES: hypothetical protein [unclassified Parabacteroides]MDH6306278.1 hypothetical protein [Parabacteroides sp. PH5-39]MDH6316931.1 hypothetical protein [Parabacteroides sp. PF5-13]MDH6321000.1 hypothetical protein [Parabacteroides sp. PH5-13]MDH6324732.1 hypothetical protein [Parabacteroides sp. PH5-8]MDH6328116.1 hypothetical protein [Parabacteroides sp. PH5-41]